MHNSHIIAFFHINTKCNILAFTIRPDICLFLLYIISRINSVLGQLYIRWNTLYMYKHQHWPQRHNIFMIGCKKIFNILFYHIPTVTRARIATFHIPLVQNIYTLFSYKIQQKNICRIVFYMRMKIILCEMSQKVCNEYNPHGISFQIKSQSKS